MRLGPTVTPTVFTAGTEPSLGHPVEYIVLNDTSEEFPATCKYCGLRYFHSHGHH